MPVHVVGILSSAENAISETAYRPGDILRMYNGVTVEVTNTDAEGRLVLGDALAWGIETYKPAAVVDLATLTGGVVVALGNTMAGVMSNNDALVAGTERRRPRRRAKRSGGCRSAKTSAIRSKSDPADIVNSAGREGHPLQGGGIPQLFRSHGRFRPLGAPGYRRRRRHGEGTAVLRQGREPAGACGRWWNG